MNKTELITAVAEEAKLSKKDAESALNAIVKAIKETVAKGEKVQIVGFGTFETRVRKARQGRNPRTNEPIDIPAGKNPAFRPGEPFKKAVDNK